jgi:hypothetical protein
MVFKINQPSGSFSESPIYGSISTDPRAYLLDARGDQRVE